MATTRQTFRDSYEKFREQYGVRPSAIMALTVCYPTILTVTIEPNADHSGGWWAMIRINDRDGIHVGTGKGRTAFDAAEDLVDTTTL